MDDDTLAKSGVLFSVGFDNGERPKCSNLLCKNTQNGLFVGETSHCQATDQQQVFAQSIGAKKRKRHGSVQHSLVMVPIYKKLFRGNWSAVRRNMESGSARIAVSL